MATQTDMTRACVLALGSIGTDFQMAVDASPCIGGTVAGHRFHRFGGGKAANVALAAARLGADARLFARTGDDDLAEQALAPLRREGVDVSEVRPVTGMQTGVTLVMVTAEGQKGFVSAANANACWDDADARRVEAALQGAPAGAVLVADCEIPVPVVEAILRSARSAGVTVVLDPSPPERVTPALLALADVVTPNATEAEQLTAIACKDFASAARAAQRLLHTGARAACVKVANGGCVWADGGGIVDIPALPVNVVDTTGGGDAFAAAFAVALGEGRHGSDAARAGVAASTLAITRFGAQPSFPTRAERDEMLRRMRAHAT